MKTAASKILPIMLLYLNTSCLPTHLQKYSRTSGQRPPSPVADINSTATSRSNNPAVSRPMPSSVYYVDNRTFRFRLGYTQVWDSMVNVLIKNYNLNIVDRTSGVITTEWDSFYIGDKVFRNKISVLVRQVGRDAVDVAIYNNVETLPISHNDNSLGSVWLPAKNDPKEVGRIVQNMAIFLNQPPPVLPAEMIASESTGDSQNNRGR